MSKSDLKSTLNLPRTAFPMKANLPQAEPRQLEEWEQQGLYRRILESRKDAPLYVLHDGPPYPTGEIHLGTGLNKVLKDLVVKSRAMAGFRAPYVPGWDCHGLPIETKVEKELPGGKGSVPPAEFRRRCREFATRYVDIHRREFKRLGVFGQWEDPYLTMSEHYEATIAGAFVTFLEKGYIYRGLKPVYWCITDATALAEAEVEYEDHTSPSIWVKFTVCGQDTRRKIPNVDYLVPNVHAVIWTTTPWTLPHNRALAFHPDYDYVVVETGAGDLLLAADMVKRVAEELKIETGRVRGTWKGRELEGLKFQHPFLDALQVPAVLADYVTLEAGTGIVHTAPGHGAEDFYTGQKYGLDPVVAMDDDGRFTEGLPEYKGKTVFEANAPIVELLRQRGALLGSGKLTHSYPHCWRCHNPVIFRATEQWFINLEHNRLRPRALEEIAKVQWTPEWGQERIHDMVATRPDWCISRQRVWGVPLVVMWCDACGARLEDYNALRHVVDTWFTKEGADAWYSRSAEELLPPGTKCTCGATKWRKETDILDVWFDSGSSHLAVLDAAKKEWPADMYLEGPDQYRGWFHSSLLVAVGVNDASPYRHVLTHGWTLDEQGRPMSKSLGNVVLPREICDKWGADLLRLWVVSQDYHADVRMSERVMTQLSEAYRKIRNTFRWVLGNLDGFDPEKHSVADSELVELDRYMLQRTAELVEKCRGWYDAFEFHRVFHAIHDFCVVDLSAFYFDVLKDRLYTFAKYSVRRRSGQAAVYRIAHALLRLLAPVLVFTAEEIWKFFPRRAGEPESIHMALFPRSLELIAERDATVDLNWSTLFLTREPVLKALEETRNKKEISGSLEAKVVIQCNGGPMDLYEAYKTSLPALFIVSQVELVNSGDLGLSPGACTVAVKRADGAKCERCWNFSTHVGENAERPTVCERCVAALEEIKSYGPEFAAAQQQRSNEKRSGGAGGGSEASGRGAS